MKKILFILLCAVIAFSCGRRTPATTESGNQQQSHKQDHADHDHSLHDHNHDHSAPDHKHDNSGQDHAAHDHKHDSQGHIHGTGCSHGTTTTYNPDDEIIFPASQAALVDFKVEIVERTSFRDVIRCGGTILPAAGEQVTVSAPVGGIISYAGSLSEGRQVSANSPLFYISSKNIASGDVLAVTRATYEKATADYQRALKLAGDSIISQRELEETRLNYLQAQAEFDALAPGGTERGSSVSASIAGYVTSILVKEGEYVETGQAMATVSRNSRLSLRADLPQKYFSRINDITGANFLTTYDEKIYELEQLGGKVLSRGLSPLPGSSLLPVYFEFRNNGTVIPDSPVEVFLLGRTRDNVLAIPVSALTEQQGLFHVYIQVDSDGYVRREVTPGGNNGLLVEIVEGLEPGERIVTRGAVNVRMAAASGDIPHGHEH